MKYKYAKTHEKHQEIFAATKLQASEKVIATMMGHLSDKPLSIGCLALTTSRVCFFRKGMMGTKLETIPISKISSIETATVLLMRTIKIYTSHDSMEFKTYTPNDEFAAFHAALEIARDEGEPSAQKAATPTAKDILRQLTEMKDDGLISAEEFDAKRAQIIDRL